MSGDTLEARVRASVWRDAGDHDTGEVRDSRGRLLDEYAGTEQALEALTNSELLSLISDAMEDILFEVSRHTHSRHDIWEYDE